LCFSSRILELSTWSTLQTANPVWGWVTSLSESRRSTRGAWSLGGKTAAAGFPALLSPERRSVVSIEWLNFFLADVQTGLGPFLAAYLASSGWNPAGVGYALASGGLISVAMQTPAERGVCSGLVPPLRGFMIFHPRFPPLPRWARFCRPSGTWQGAAKTKKAGWPTLQERKGGAPELQNPRQARSAALA
jgi:hypothetical protein